MNTKSMSLVNAWYMCRVLFSTYLCQDLLTSNNRNTTENGLTNEEACPEVRLFIVS
jgi:hypothetical protein